MCLIHRFVGLLVSVVAVVSVLLLLAVANKRQDAPGSVELVPTAEIELVAEPVASKAAVTILSTGDMMLGRSVNYFGTQKRDFSWAWREIDKQLGQFDYVVANLENPLTASCPVTNEGMIFCGDASAGAALAESAIDLVTLANNHIYNHGVDGYRQTRQILTTAGQSFVGEDELFKTQIGDELYGFLAFDDVTSALDETDFAATIADAGRQVDHLLVAIHWGAEYRYQPLDRQVELGHIAIDSGAEVVLGNHSHWLGTVELYRDRPIIYSHGNFIFDQMWSDETRYGLAAAWHWENGTLGRVEIYPIEITNYGLAHWVAGTTTGDAILRRFLTESQLGEMTADHVTINLASSAPEPAGVRD